MTLLDHVELEPAGDPVATVIWLHGLGADGHDFEPIVPEIPGGPTFWVLITGVMEIAIGVGLILPRTRRIAAFGSMAFLVGIYWANLNMWVNNIPLDGKTYANHWHVLRLVAQLGMIGLSYAIWQWNLPDPERTGESHQVS